MNRKYAVIFEQAEANWATAGHFATPAIVHNPAFSMPIAASLQKLSMLISSQYRLRSQEVQRKPMYVLLALPVFFATAIFAQTTFGSITGTVTDPSGLPVVAAEILGTETGSGYLYRTKGEVGGLICPLRRDLVLALEGRLSSSREKR